MNSMKEAARSVRAAVKAGVLSLVPLRNTILFESNPDFSCNTYPVFQQLRKELPDYKMVWRTDGNSEIPEGVDDVLVFNSKEFLQGLKYTFYFYTAKAFISSNRVLFKTRPEQVNLFLCHGSKTKKTKGLYEIGSDVDYINVQSHFFDDIITYEYNCEKEKLVYLGYPRCDWLYKTGQLEKVREKMGLPADCRFLVWLPTFRKHKSSAEAKIMDSSKYASIGMPLVYSLKELHRLNDFLEKQNLYLIYKPHPAQDVSGLKDAKLEHVRVIYDANLMKNNLQLYELLGASDGLITDYSSVFFDYLLLDKPIATTTDDAEEWKKMTGFAFDLDAFLDEATTRASTLDELIAFLEKGDDKAEGRKRIRELTNMYFDGDSAKRVAAFIREKIGE